MVLFKGDQCSWNTSVEGSVMKIKLVKLVKNLPAVQETWVRSLGWEVPLEKAMATHSNILAWRIPWTEERGRVQSIGS